MTAKRRPDPMSLFYSVTTVVIGMLFLLFALISVGLVSYPALLGVVLVAFGGFVFVRAKITARTVSDSR